MDNQLVIPSSDGKKQVTTSLKVAAEFGKRHDHVLRDIRELDCSNEFRLSNFGEVKMRELADGTTAEAPYYEITRDGFSFLAMGYTGKKAAEFKEKFIKAFGQMEAMLNSDDYIVKRGIDILAKRVDKLLLQNTQLEKKLELQAAVIEQQAPAVKYVEEVLQAENAHTITTIAKELGMKSAIELNQLLKQWDVQYRVDKHWVLKAKYQGKDYTKTRTYAYSGSNGETKTSIETVWTEAGRKFIHELVKSRMQ